MLLKSTIVKTTIKTINFFFKLVLDDVTYPIVETSIKILFVSFIPSYVGVDDNIKMLYYYIFQSEMFYFLRGACFLRAFPRSMSAFLSKPLLPMSAARAMAICCLIIPRSIL